MGDILSAFFYSKYFLWVIGLFVWAGIVGLIWRIIWWLDNKAADRDFFNE